MQTEKTVIEKTFHDDGRVEEKGETVTKDDAGVTQTSTWSSTTRPNPLIEALAQELDRRAALADKNAECPDSAKILREVARSCRVAIAAKPE